MKGKSYQRWLLACLVVVGYFAIIVIAMFKDLMDITQTLVAALPPIMAGSISTWMLQAGQEKQNGKNGNA